ncbi:MAG: hypothetical protein K5888_06950 [Lachnospiraceae bacterium]|nr:hypothetical protein [Lachnospiraceae bacterium]
MDDIDKIINMLDQKVSEGVSRLKVNISEDQEEGSVKEVHHHGRCDVGSPWANGTVRNAGETDGCS